MSGRQRVRLVPLAVSRDEGAVVKGGMGVHRSSDRRRARDVLSAKQAKGSVALSRAELDGAPPLLDGRSRRRERRRLERAAAKAARRAWA
ncbi:hypothetical protein G419_16925 [Rhodococcus triatomae BKS 15-14]|nr:hypothetical protein G419_16925 [Rhodococcus triatomae BKS 15-14]